MRRLHTLLPDNDFLFTKAIYNDNFVIVTVFAGFGHE
jgi:hypothetical protein